MRHASLRVTYAPAKRKFIILRLAAEYRRGDAMLRAKPFLRTNLNGSQQLRQRKRKRQKKDFVVRLLLFSFGTLWYFYSFFTRAPAFNSRMILCSFQKPQTDRYRCYSIVPILAIAFSKFISHAFRNCTEPNANLLHLFINLNAILV